MYNLSGLWTADIGDGKKYTMQLPGTLDENKIGGRDMGKTQWHPEAELGNAGEDFDENAPISNRLTRKYIFEGEVRLTRRILWEPPEGKRVFVEAEKARCLRLLVDGREVSHFVEPTLSTPHVFEVTGLLNGDNEITLLSDNSYPGLPYDTIIFSSAATDESQTNWNGVLGYFRIRVEEPVFISSVRVYPENKNTLKVVVEIITDGSYKGKLTIQSETLSKQYELEVSVNTSGVSLFVLDNMELADGVHKWDEYEGKLYALKAILEIEKNKKIFEVDSRVAEFGIRTFGDNGSGRLALNGRAIFLRSEANCCEFPESGHPPMTMKEWMEILQRFRSYGVNCMRFHSYCPPEAAFSAADALGMLMQPELSNWNSSTTFESDESYSYFKKELKQIIYSLANHPSFVMLTFGNELGAGDTGHRRMDELLDFARSLDRTRLYANGSNVHFGGSGCDANSDFYTSSKFYEEALRGTDGGWRGTGKLEGYINNQYPGTNYNYDDTMKRIRESFKKPVFSFEVGQYEVLPDFRELEDFKGISEPANLRLIQERVNIAGIPQEDWEHYVEATGELSRIGYREEVEAAMRTKDLSGISLLGLQDFPGQGTALVGMMNSHLQPKPYAFAEPENFRSFFTAQLPLVLMPKYTWESKEEFSAEVVIANYGKTELTGPLRYVLTTTDEKITVAGKMDVKNCPPGYLTKVGRLKILMNDIAVPARLNLTVTIDTAVNNYPVWVYPRISPRCPEAVYETDKLDEEAKKVLEEGGIVYLSPASTKEALPSSIQAQFTTDFWTVGTYSLQSGAMGQLIDKEHPLFADFPTEFYTNWQWWPMASQRAVILPKRYQAIVTEIDSYAYLRPMAQLFECCCGNGRLLFSSFGLQDLQQFPEARALLASIYRYLDSADFVPEQVIEIEEIAALTYKKENGKE